jgi:Tfp pilus assembly protein PilP
MRATWMLLAAFMALSFSAAPAAGQAAASRPSTPVPGAAAPGQTSGQPAADAAVAPVNEGYVYAPQGRRDPFVSLIARGTDQALPGGRRPEGLPGLAVGELSVRGVMQSHGGYVAILQAPDGKTYIARPGDRLLDGSIRSITEQGLAILQEVNDPLSLVKQREVRKGLRASDEGK